MRRLSMLVMVLLMAACGNDPGGTNSDSPQSGVGPGISVSEAVQAEFDVPVLVNGYLFIDAEGKVVLAEAILESYPPQPGGASLEVVGLDLSSVEGLRTDQGRSWTDDTIQVLGTVEGDRLIVGAASG